MSEIALYNVLTKLGATADEAERAVADVASSKANSGEVATKADIKALKAETKADIVEIKTELKYLRWLIVLVVSVAVGIIKYL